MITISVVGTDRVRAKLDAMKARIDLRKTIEGLSIEYAGFVKSNYLSGDPIHNRTGTLRRSVTYRIEQEGTRVQGIIGPRDLPYAAVLEYGYSGRVSVRGFDRVANNIFGTGRSAQQHIRPFERNMRMPAFHYMRDSIEAFQPRIQQRLSQFVREATR